MSHQLSQLRSSGGEHAGDVVSSLDTPDQFVAVAPRLGGSCRTHDAIVEPMSRGDNPSIGGSP